MNADNAFHIDMLKPKAIRGGSFEQQAVLRMTGYRYSF